MVSFRDLKIGGLYFNITNGLVFKVIDIKYENNNYYLVWKARNRKTLEGRTFKDNVTKINFSNIFEEKDFEKYEN